MYYVQSTTYNMMEVFPIPSARTGAGDPARTLRLLWHDPAVLPRHGPRQGLTVDQIVTAATALADADGLDAVTMRRLAGNLGVVPMTLYTYVPGKAELLDLMLDAAYQRMPRADTTGLPWRQRIAAIAAENRALFEAHPWAAVITTGRPPLPFFAGKSGHSGWPARERIDLLPRFAGSRRRPRTKRRRHPVARIPHDRSRKRR